MGPPKKEFKKERILFRNVFLKKIIHIFQHLNSLTTTTRNSYFSSLSQAFVREEMEFEIRFLCRCRYAATVLIWFTRPERRGPPPTYLSECNLTLNPTWIQIHRAGRTDESYRWCRCKCLLLDSCTSTCTSAKNSCWGSTTASPCVAM